MIIVSKVLKKIGPSKQLIRVAMSVDPSGSNESFKISHLTLPINDLFTFLGNLHDLQIDWIKITVIYTQK